MSWIQYILEDKSGSIHQYPVRLIKSNEKRSSDFWILLQPQNCRKVVRICIAFLDNINHS